MDIQAHWNNIYQTKQPWEVSWTQEKPETSLRFIHSFNLPKDAPIIDIGGGDSKLADCLLQEGYEDITVLDISHFAIDRAKNRLGSSAEKVHWLIGNLIHFKPERKYLLWHDRATFHFLLTEREIAFYLEIARSAVINDGFLTMGTFSIFGPQKCSGMEVKQYHEESLADQLKNGFDKIECILEDHVTPFNTKQNFIFCSFRRMG